MRRLSKVVFVGLTLIFALAVLPWAFRSFWEARSSNPVRRGVERAGELGCFACHGSLGQGGLPDPGIVGHEVPGWTGKPTDAQIHQYILYGTEQDLDRTLSVGEGRMAMPAYEDRLVGTDLADLTASFKVLSGLAMPPKDSPARRGYDLSKKWRCDNCHNAGGSGGLPNPGSFSGFVPGWYGADFEDLVRSREEFDQWLEEGSLPRLRGHWLAKHFLRRQALTMPRYTQFTAKQKDALWAYTAWLAETDGGHAGVEPQW